MCTEGAMCHLVRNSYHLRLVILHRADVFVHSFVAVIATHELYIYVAVILLRLSYFQLYVKFVFVFTVFSAFRRPPRSALIANCNIENFQPRHGKLSLTI
jgi:hypothetical protein